MARLAQVDTPKVIDPSSRKGKPVQGSSLMYGLGAGEWKPKWGPLPGKPGCRLRRGTQHHRWREVIELARNTLLQAGWSDASADVLGLKIVELLEKNADVSLEVDGRCAIPRKIPVEFGIPTSANAIKVGRAALAERNAKAGPSMAVPQTLANGCQETNQLAGVH